MPCFSSLARGSLAVIAASCLIFTGVSIFLTLLAGTLQLDGDYPDGPGRLLLSSLSIVRFRGLVTHPNTNGSPSYQVTLHWFMNAFGWEWPQGSWEQSCGIVHNINGFLPGPALTLPGDLTTVARGLGLPVEDYQCIEGDATLGLVGGICHNEFLSAWDEAQPPLTSVGTAIPLFSFYLASITILAIAVAEVLVRRDPSWAKCSCGDFISKRGLCPCLKDDEEMTPKVRNRIRLWYISFLAVVYVIAVESLLRRAMELASYLREVDSQVGNMEVELGSGFLTLAGLTALAIVTSMACLVLRGRISSSQSWMDEQGIKSNSAELLTNQ